MISTHLIFLLQCTPRSSKYLNMMLISLYYWLKENYCYDSRKEAARKAPIYGGGAPCQHREHRWIRYVLTQLIVTKCPVNFNTVFIRQDKMLQKYSFKNNICCEDKLQPVFRIQILLSGSGSEFFFPESASGWAKYPNPKNPDPDS